MIEVIIVVNDQPIRRVAIYNRGPVGGPNGDSYDPPDHEGGGGLRKYDWETTQGHRAGSRGDLLHRRSDGAELLCADVLQAVADRIRQTRTMEQAPTWKTDDPEG